jgi:hypothetical protein
VADAALEVSVAGSFSRIGLAARRPKTQRCHVVVDDEPAVHGVLPAIGVRDVVGVRVATEPVLRLEKGDVMGPGEQVGSGQAGDPCADHGHRRPP